jgi:hypothetical protein
MNILYVKKLEECLDRTMIFEYGFSAPVSEADIRRLGRGGDLSYFPEFARPFFKLVTSDGVQIKGIVGDVSVQVVFPAAIDAAGRDAFGPRLAGLEAEGVEARPR